MSKKKKCCAAAWKHLSGIWQRDPQRESGWPTTNKLTKLDDFFMLEDITVACVCSEAFKFPSLHFYIFFHKYFIKNMFFLGGVRSKSRIHFYMSDLYFLSPFPSLPLADWLLKCCFLSRELQNSARARMMEITFLASLCGAAIRPGVYFKCNWVWCVHKGKTLCLWPKRCTLFRFWIRGQTYSPTSKNSPWNCLLMLCDWFCFIPASFRPSRSPTSLLSMWLPSSSMRLWCY